MKIISKFKDYYDYYVGIYGEDPLLVFDRRGDLPIFNPSIKEEEVGRTVFYITDEKIPIYWYKGCPYYTWEDVQKLDALLKKDKNEGLIYSAGSLSTIRKKYYWRLTKKDYLETLKAEKPFNTLLREPILCKDNLYNGKTMQSELNKNVKLADWGFPNIIPANEMWQRISAFLGYLKDHQPIPNKQTDKEKILSHGFDYKKSFRHRK